MLQEQEQQIHAWSELFELIDGDKKAELMT